MGWDLLWLWLVSKILLQIFILTGFFSLMGCTRVVTLPVRSVVDWTEEKRLSSESVLDLTGKSPVLKPVN
jgi:hypothetical protein